MFVRDSRSNRRRTKMGGVVRGRVPLKDDLNKVVWGGMVVIHVVHIQFSTFAPLILLQALHSLPNCICLKSLKAED